jgi:tetratricopeptide (TPR) repeat protein
MDMSLHHLLLVGLLSVSPGATSVFAAQDHQHQHDAGQPPEQLGRVSFETSCDAAVRGDFNRGIALLHSFWFSAAADQFTRVAERDPGCAMAWWGVAMSRWGNPFAPSRPVRALEEGRAAIAKAAAAGPRTDRERQYVAAATELFKDFEAVPHRTRIVSYERAMQALYESHPKDREAAAFYALAVNQTARPDDKTYVQQLKAAAILEVLFEEQPDHPGAAHYLIHAYDHPSLAERALPAARRYAKVAPDAPHALHMPSHTFTRVGLWEDSIATNRASADAARRAKSPGEVLHALDYQVYAYLQLAQDRAARQVIEELQAITATLNNTEQYGQAGLFAATAIPARYALERGAWAEAAALEPRTTAFPFIDAIAHYARAIGRARSGDAAAARVEADRLAGLHDALRKSQDEYWAQQVEIQHTSALGWAAFADGRKDEALRLLREATAIEASTDKAAITPGPLAPARELLGEMLLELDRPAEALVEFEGVMKTEPNRFRTLYGAGRAASLAGDPAKASQYFAQLVEMCEAADSPSRPELEHARRARSSAGR